MTIEMARYTRRDFIRTVGAAGVGLCASGLIGCGTKERAEAVARVLRPNGLSDKLAVAGGGDIEQMLRRAMDALGGMDSLVKKGDTVVVKPNIGWAQPPEHGACSNPETVSVLVRMCLEAGAAAVKVFDRPCDDKRRSYHESGIESAAKEAGAKVSYVDDSRFLDIDIPDGKSLKEWPVYRDALECDVLINVPIPKVHNSTGLTLSLKNLMGIAGGNRGEWHRDYDLSTAITDFYTVVPCDLSVMDAYRIMLHHGPRGGRLDDVEVRKTIAVCKDNVAADAFAARELFGRDPQNIGYIRQAHDRGLGDMQYETRLLKV